MPSPTIDGSAKATASTASTIGVALTTTKMNDLIYVVVANELSAAARQVTGVSGGGLIFTKRASLSGTFSNAIPTNSHGELSIWTAPSSGILPAVTLTATLDGAFDDACIVAFGVNGLFNYLDSFDTNASVPQIVNAPDTSAFPTITISTDEIDDILFYFQASYSTYTTTSQPSGFTVIQTAANSGGALSCGLQCAYLAVSAKQVNLATAGRIANATAPVREIAYMDAMTSDFVEPEPAAAGALAPWWWF